MPQPNYCYRAKILRIVDGDTYEVQVDVGFRMFAHLPLRLAHVDAPEHNTSEGQVTIKFVTALLTPLPLDVVVCTYKPTDKYGRYLADVFYDGPDGQQSLAAELLIEKHAVPYEGGKKE